MFSKLPAVLTALLIACQSVSDCLLHRSSECPDADQLKPCTCIGWSSTIGQNINWDIECNRASSHDLNNLINHTGFRATDTEYQQLRVSSLVDAIDIGQPFGHLVEMFKFSSVKLFNVTINSISQNLTVDQFSSIEELILNQVHLNSTELTSGGHLFQFSSKLTGLRSLVVNGTNLERINANAFDSSSQVKLTQIKLTNNLISSIGSGAFSALLNVTGIDLSSNRIRFIDDFALSFDLSSGKPVQIDLDHNLLNSTGFSRSSLKRLDNRPLIIFMRHNHLNYLPEAIFRQTMQSNSIKLFLAGNPVECTNCMNYWMIKLIALSEGDLQLINKFNDIKCNESGGQIMAIKPLELAYCELTQDDLEQSIEGLLVFLMKLKLVSVNHGNHIKNLINEL